VRAALKRAKASGHALTLELETAAVVSQDLVKPEPAAQPPIAGPS